MSRDSRANQSTIDLKFSRKPYSSWLENLNLFVERYNLEHIGKMPKVVLSDDRYRSLENANVLVAAGAFINDGMVAVLSYILSTSRHYEQSYRIALHDFFYVEPEYRGGLLPLNIYRYAEAELAALRVKRVFMVDHTRFVSRAEAFKRLGYTQAEVVYEKVLKPE